MNCKHVRNQLDSFVDGELDAASILAIRRHFERCACCSQEYQALTILKSELKSMPTPKLDPEFEDRLLAHVFHVAAQRPAMVRRRFQVASFAAALAAAATLATVQVVAEQHRSERMANQNRFELDRDQAFAAGEDPLSGGQFMIPASYGR